MEHKKIRIIPHLKRAKARVKEHGETMLLLVELSDRFLVGSIGNTWRGEQWKGWFLDVEASFEVIDEG
jgi:hypothetical protein